MESIVYRCKICGKKFSYADFSVQLHRERGESAPERCPECRKKHGDEIKELRVPFAVAPIRHRASPFAFPKSGITFRGERKKVAVETQPELDETNFGIHDEDMPRVYAALGTHQVVVLVSSTGSGKSTFVPARLIQAPSGYENSFVSRLLRQGQIAVTQPRIPATYNIAVNSAKVAGAKVGPDQAIGYRHGSQDGSKKGEQWGKYNLITTVTDGTLRNWITDGSIGRYSLIIVDEAHERSVNIDMILALLKLHLHRFPHLRVMIVSATIDEEKFVKAFHGAGHSTAFLELENRKPIHYFGPHHWHDSDQHADCMCWLCKMSLEERIAFWKQFSETVSEENLHATTAKFMKELFARTSHGSAFLFLDGEDNIKNVAKKLCDVVPPEIAVVPLYSRLGAKAVERCLSDTEGKRRVLVATNIGETSITVNDIVYVVDSGLIKESRWDAATRSNTLKSRHHSKDGCRQRWGRAGRVQEGFAYTLYTAEEFKQFSDHTPPEITRSGGEDIIVAAKAAGLSNLKTIPWIDPPSKEEMARANAAITATGLSDSEGDINPKGLEMLKISRPATEAALFVAADVVGCLIEALSVFLLFRSRDEEMRIGENLYTAQSPLFLFDKDWSLAEKNRALIIHRMMRYGCQDDVAFLAKLMHCFWTACEVDKGHEAENKGEKWAAKHYLNYEALKNILEYRDKDLLKRTFGKSTSENRWVLMWERLEALRYLIRTMMPDIGLGVIARKKEIPDFSLFLPICFFYPDDWMEMEKGQIIAPAGLQAQWLGPRNEKGGKVIDQVDGSLGVLLSPIGNEEILSKFAGRQGEELTITIHRFFQSPFGRGGWVRAVTQEGDVFLIDNRDLVFAPTDHILKQLTERKLSVTIGRYEDGMPILSCMSRVITDLKALREESIKSSNQMFAGFVAGIDEERITIGMQRLEGVIQTFEVHRNYIPGRKTSHFQLGEEVSIRLVPNTARCQMEFATPLSREATNALPQGFSYDEKNQKLSFPSALDRHILNKWPAGEEVAESVWRFSWRYALQAEVKQLVGRVGDLEVGQLVNGTVIRTRSDRNSSTLRFVEILLENGVVGFLTAEEFGNDPSLVKPDAFLFLEVLAINDDSSVKLTANVNDAYRALSPGVQVRGIVQALKNNQQGRVAGVSVALHVRTPRGTFPANGFLPVSHLLRISGTQRAAIPEVGTFINAMVLEVSVPHPKRPTLILKQL